METKKKQGKCYRYLKAIWHYKSSHMWCSFASAILLSVFLLFFITMWYMKDRFYKNLAETTYSTEQALLESVEMNIATQMEMYINYGSQISVDTELTAKIENVVGEDGLLSALERKSIRDTLSSAIKVSNTIVGIALVSKDGVLRQYDRMEMSIAGSRDIWEETNEDKLRMAFQEVQEMVNRQNVPRYYILTEPKCHPNDQSKGLIHIAYPLKDMHDYACMRYMLVLSFDSTPMEVLLKQLNPNKEKYIQAYVEDRDGEILMNTGMEEQNGDQQSGFHAQESSVPMERTQELCVTIGDYEWILHVVIDKDILQEKVNEMYVQMVFIVVMAILIIMLLLFFVTNKILRPVKIISSFISGVKDGNTREQIQIEGTNEIWQLAQEYNEMIHAIGQASDQVEEEHQFAIESMRMQQRAEREALESQINAHFICNTLNVINYEAIDSGNYKVSLLLKKLSNILRYTFDQKHQEVYIFQEISWIEQYLFLQKERMDGIFDYQIVFDVDYDNWPCRKLMLQPFVENSILHGFEGMACGGLVCIKGEGYKEFLKITIEDNGCGMDRHRSGIIQEILKNPLLAKDKEVGIGISNVITRMRMYYGEQFQVSMKTEEGKGTSFVFLLPMPPSVYEKETDDKQIQPEKYTAEDQEDIEEDMETEQGQERLQAENDRREVPDALGGGRNGSQGRTAANCRCEVTE